MGKMNVWKNVTQKEIDILGKISRRAGSIRIDEPSIALILDLLSVHSGGTPLDFEKLLEAEAYDFYYDVYGITRNIDRVTGKLLNGFIPKSAK